jgi:predicted Rossmann fold flavoprotein
VQAEQSSFDAIILGAGAAGLMAALTAGQRGRRVLLLDHAEEAGAKILISGGGRCNFTNRETPAARFLSANPHFAKSALSRFPPAAFIALIDRHGIAWHEKTLGQLFCDGSARQVVAMLLAECAAAKVDLRLGHAIRDVAHDGHGFRVETSGGSFTAPALVLATGGLSIPKMGATGLAYVLARQFGLPVVPPTPALVPLTFAEPELSLMRGLSGVALEAIARVGKAAFREALLFTHRGLSGPAILQASSYLDPDGALLLDLLPGQDARSWLLDLKRSRPRIELRTALAEALPQRLAQALAEGQTRPMAEITDKVLLALADRLKTWRLTPSGSEGFAKAEVTRGGIDTAALSSQTMKSRTLPGLYAVGEAVDVTGWLGGYNFQWAWASGWVAGQSI